ncbi:MAG TPA: KUP/HAK/KT family potassium transporter [Saprospiraceae bacterium]|nr:KUP/HAK/KT family potassium transporter [Saprospiraceae bacterium]
MESSHSHLNKITFAGLLITLGIIYGDIGTSPLYVMGAVLSGIPVTERLIIGSISCVIWTLTLATTVKYILITIRADNKGEGGIFSLFSIVRRERKWLVVVAIIGGAMLLADGIITPSITVSSAVNELRVFSDHIPIIPIVIGILVTLFLFQRFGTAALGKFFGPVMLIWFSMMALFGIIHISDNLHILKAFSPYYAFDILRDNPKGIGLLGAIFLCTTGAEALYSDLGHCGRKNIQMTWIYVKISLVLNYLGQGAFLLNHLGEVYTKNPFYSLMPEWFLPTGILIATLASIVASQALITGSFTLVSEGISLNLYPRLTIDYPTNIKGQLYIPLVNNFLMIGCVLVVLYFRDPLKMEAAYGLAITITMLMTTILLFFYMRKMKWNPIFYYFITAIFVTLELIFMSANVGKIIHGGFITLIIASIIIFLNWIWRQAFAIKNKHTQYVKIEHYKDQLSALSHDMSYPKYATHLVYLTKAQNEDELEKGILYSILQKQPKRADLYWFINVQVVDEPFRMDYKVNNVLKDDIVRVTFFLGFRVQQRISVFLRYVITDMLKKKEIDIDYKYHFMREANGIGDFKFIYLEDILSYESEESFIEKFVLAAQIFIKNFTATPEKWFGLDTSVVQAEKVPLIIRPVTGVRLKRIE